MFTPDKAIQENYVILVQMYVSVQVEEKKLKTDYDPETYHRFIFPSKLLSKH